MRYYLDEVPAKIVDYIVNSIKQILLTIDRLG